MYIHIFVFYLLTVDFFQFFLYANIYVRSIFLDCKISSVNNFSNCGCFSAFSCIFYSFLIPMQTFLSNHGKVIFVIIAALLSMHRYTIPPPPSIPAPIPPCRKDMYDFSSFYNTLGKSLWLMISADHTI